MDPVETKTNLYQVGDLLDVLDETSTWLPSQVIQVIDQDTFVVHFLFFDVKYNETINQQDLGCLQRLAPYGTHTFVNSTSTLQMNQRIDVFDMHPASNKWLKAKVIDIWENEVRVHFWNFADKFDETLPKKTRRIAPYGLNTMKTHADWKLMERNHSRRHSTASRTSSYGEKNGSRTFDSDIDSDSDMDNDNSDNENNENNSSSSNRRKRFRPTKNQLSQYIEALADKELEIVGAEGDGNCLFRTVSHQMYGRQDHHAMIRSACVDYMENEAAYFSNFVVGGHQTFAEYLSNMRQDGEWGDEPEIQAMCEMYDRPADVYVYDEEEGCRVVRRMHNVRVDGMQPATRRPLRLSFYGGGHYDSLVETNERRRDFSSREPGDIEHASLEVARARLGRRDGENVNANDLLLDAALRASRLAWDEHGGTSMEEAQMEWAMRDSGRNSNNNNSSSSKSNNNNSSNNQDDELQRALVASQMHNHRQRQEEDELQRALAASKDQNNDSNHTTSLLAKEEAELQKVLAISQEQYSTSGTGGTGGNGERNEDDALRRAIEASKNISSSGQSKEEEQLQRVLEMSRSTARATDDELQRAIAASMGGNGDRNCGWKTQTEDDDAEMQRAIAASMRK